VARNNRGGRNNNPSGRNQYSSWGVMEMARERPVTAAAVAAGTAAAGLFLWSKRAAISEQLTNLSDQIGEWTQNMSTDQSGMWDSDGATGGVSAGQSSDSTRSQRGMSETGGGNASLGRNSGGGGSRGSTSGRGRAQSSAATQQ
jgi:hypothetical protein